jgi:enoyl-CoA hydratase/carnithine racemase
VSEDTVLYAADGKVGIVTLNRPAKLNALTMDMRLAIESVLLRADADDTTSVIVLRAEGRSFCVGFDVGGAAGTSGRGGMTP